MSKRQTQSKFVLIEGEQVLLNTKLKNFSPRELRSGGVCKCGGKIVGLQPGQMFDTYYHCPKCGTERVGRTLRGAR